MTSFNDVRYGFYLLLDRIVMTGLFDDDKSNHFPQSQLFLNGLFGQNRMTQQGRYAMFLT